MRFTKVTLCTLTENDREAFVLGNQEAFRYGALEEFGLRDNHLDRDGEIISRETIECCLNDPCCEAYRIVCDGKTVGGVVLRIDTLTHRNELELLFVSPKEHGKGIGYGAWQAVEALHPETSVWETCTPYFDKRNLHFYINKCGFHAVEFWCEYNPEPPDAEEAACKKAHTPSDEGPDEMFRFEKVMKPTAAQE